MRALEFITGHAIFKLHYNQIDQMKTTFVLQIGTVARGVVLYRNPNLQLLMKQLS